MENDESHKDNEIEEELDEEIPNRLNSSIDELEKVKLDYKRIRKIDQTKKRAVIESVFDERTVFLLNKILKSGPLDRIEGGICC